MSIVLTELKLNIKQNSIFICRKLDLLLPKKFNAKAKLHIINRQYFYALFPSFFLVVLKGWRVNT